ncbi:MAG: hypothetical protein K8T90_12095 [Planctomycetes bacterium]|nr:hypothetical protein [Planctomycetota bacterium]
MAPVAAPFTHGLDAVLSGRTIREWIASSATGDPASATCRDARSALRSDPAATAEAIVEELQGGATIDGLPRLLAWLLPDVRDALVPRLLDLLHDPATRATAVALLGNYADSRGFGRHDRLVADAVSRLPVDADLAAVLARLGSAFGPVAPRVLSPLPETREGLAPDWWSGLDAAASEVAAALLPREGAETRSVKVAIEWLTRNARSLGPALGSLRARIGSATHDDERNGILRVLARSGDAEAIADVVRRTASSSAAMRQGATAALAECPVRAPGVVAALEARMNDADEDVRWYAWNALARQAAVTDDALSAISVSLESDDDEVRDAARNAIRSAVESDGDGYYAEVARWAPPLLDSFTGPGDPAVRATVLRAMEPGSVAASRLAILRHHPDERVRAAANRLDPRPADVGPASATSWLEILASCEYERAPQERFEAILGDYIERGGRLTDLLDPLRLHLRATYDEGAILGLRGAAKIATRLGRRAAPLRDALSERLVTAPGDRVQNLLLRALAAAGRDVTDRIVPLLAAGGGEADDLDEVLRLLPSDALPGVMSALTHTEPRVRRGLAVALGWMDVAAETAGSLLVPLLDDHDRSVRFAAAASMLRRRFRVDLALEVVRRELDVWPPATDATAERDVTEILKALADAGATALPALDVVHRALRSPVAYAPHVAWICRVLRGFGPAAAPAVPELTAIVEHRSGLEALSVGTGFYSGPPPDVGYVAVAATEALGAIGPAAREAAPSLRRALVSQDRRLRTAAAAALERIEGR